MSRAVYCLLVTQRLCLHQTMRGHTHYCKNSIQLSYFFIVVVLIFFYHTHTHTHTHMHTHTHTHTCIHTHTHTHAYTHTHIHTCIHTQHAYTHICTHTCIHTLMHTHTYIHTHTTQHPLVRERLDKDLRLWRESPDAGQEHADVVRRNSSLDGSGADPTRALL